MSRSTVTKLHGRRARAELLAESLAGDALAIRLDHPALAIEGRHRRAVCYCEPDLSTERFAYLLRELADQLDGGP